MHAHHAKYFCLLPGIFSVICSISITWYADLKARLHAVFKRSDQLKLLFHVGSKGCQDSVRCQASMYFAQSFAFRLATGCILKAGMPCEQDL